jgi:hypothetical protein
MRRLPVHRELLETGVRFDEARTSGESGASTQSVFAMQPDIAGPRTPIMPIAELNFGKAICIRTIFNLAQGRPD